MKRIILKLYQYVKDKIETKQKKEKEKRKKDEIEISLKHEERKQRFPSRKKFGAYKQQVRSAMLNTKRKDIDLFNLQSIYNIYLNLKYTEN